MFDIFVKDTIRMDKKRKITMYNFNMLNCKNNNYFCCYLKFNFVQYNCHLLVIGIKSLIYYFFRLSYISGMQLILRCCAAVTIIMILLQVFSTLTPGTMVMLAAIARSAS